MDTSQPTHGTATAAAPAPAAGRILFVDDDPNLLAAFGRTLRHTFTFDSALGGEEALRLIRDRGPFSVIVADMNMPGMNGIELLERVRALSPDTIPLMLTGNADQPTAVDSVNRAHVFRFLNKPCPQEALIAAIEAALQRHEHKRTERELLEGTLTGCVKLLTDVLGIISPGALGRGQRLRLAAGHLARRLGLEPAWECEVAALLANIGYAAIPPGIMEKSATGTPLTLVEETMVRRVPQIGRDLLSDIPRLAGVAAAVLYQKRNFDGSGFPPEGPAGSEIPVAARVLRILTDRLELENDGIVKERALAVMKEREGRYDPHLLEECFRIYPTFLPSALSGDRPVLSLSVEELVPGHVVVSEILTVDEGLVLVGAGHVLTASVVERIRNFAELGDVKEPILVQAPAEEDPAPAPRGSEMAATAA